MEYQNTELGLNGPWRLFTPADGLPGYKFHDVAQDLEGYLWFAGHETGVVRYDGNEFHLFGAADGLRGSSALALQVDRSGRVWVATDLAVFCYDGTQFREIASIGGIQIIFVDRDERIWLGGYGQFGFLDAGQYRDLSGEYSRKFGLALVEDRDQCWGIAQDGTGTVWLGFEYLVGFDGERVIRADLPPAHSYYAVGADREGHVYAACGNVWKGDIKGFEIIPGGKALRRAQSDREGRMWFNGTPLLCYTGAAWKSPAAPEFSFSQITGICQDREGFIWCSSYEHGIACYDPHHIQLVNIEKKTWSATASSLVEDGQGDIWLATGKILRYNGGEMGALGAEQGLSIGNCVVLCTGAGGDIFVGGLGGVWRYDGEKFQALAADFSPQLVLSLALDRQGRLLCGHTPGARLSRFDGDRVECLIDEQFSNITIVEKSFGFIQTVAKICVCKNGDTWFAVRSMDGAGRGVGLRREGVALRWFNRQDGLPHDTVWDMVEDRHGHMWFATSEGVACYDGVDFNCLDISDGLPSKFVRCICEDDRGHLWFGTDNGLAHYHDQLLQVVCTQQIDQVYSLIQSRDGVLWMETRSGLVQYRPSTTPPLIDIIQVITDRTYDTRGEVLVETTAAQVSFSYRGRSFGTDLSHMQYLYRLRGYQEQWQAATRARQVHYHDLPPGDYLFEVKAIDRDLNQSAPTEQRLKILPDPRDLKIDMLEQRVQERTRELEERLVQIEQLSVVNLEQERSLRQRMQLELEEARQLQLSMLPTDRPDFAHAEIAWYMKTATEVGGDYYDYALSDDGALTLALGDATGHGMQAGTVVTATKSLFKNLANRPIITDIFHAMSHSLKGMNLPRLTMAMVMLKISDYKLQISSAGIPPALLFRADTKEIEEIEIAGMPLGQSIIFQYEQRAYDLCAGDIIVLMSDGLPERLDLEDQQLGYDRSAELFEQCIGKSPEEICQYLAQGGDEWANGRPADDDITFVVLKIN